MSITRIVPGAAEEATPCSPDRREFLRAIGAVTLAGSALGTALTPASASEASTRGAVPELNAGATTVAVTSKDGLVALPAWRLRQLIVNREVSATEVLEQFLRRIEKFDPVLHAFRLVDAAGARQQALLADQAVKSGAALGPLHGVPVAVKELLTVRGFPPPGNASFAVAGAQANLAQRDDVEIERLRAAGAVMVGTTVAGLHTGALIPDTDHLPRNPWRLTHITGGSSAGSAAAVAAGLVPLALGNDGLGSTRLPSALCGLIGLHPTRGLVPHVDFRSPTPLLQVTTGPMSRDIRDIAIALQVLAGPDGRDFICLQDTPPDYQATLQAGVAGRVFAWTDDFGYASAARFHRDPSVVAHVRESVQRLLKVGGAVEATPMKWEDPTHAQLVSQIFAAGGKFNLPGFLEGSVTQEETIAAVQLRARNWERFREVFSKYDFLLSPTVGFTALAVEDWESRWRDFSGEPRHRPFVDSYTAHTMMGNWLGLPAISVPAGFVAGLPVGLQIYGRPGSEAGMLQAAQAFLLAST